jgi:predicted ATPase/class 3 adenylate cyclase
MVGETTADASARLHVGTVTFLFTDIEGSTALLSRVGIENYAAVLAEHHRAIRQGLSAHDGTEVDTQGDAFFAVFSSPRRGATAAVSIQRAFAATKWPGREEVRVRMGLHLGEAAETANGPVGYDVHRAARIAAVAHGGQILVSETAAALLRDSLTDSVELLDLGPQRLKDMGRPEHIFQLVAEGLTREFPPLRSLDNPALANNLPGQSSRFIGRRRELVEVRALLESNRVLTLTGPGGSGKTRLALQLAADLLDGSGDGVWLVELAAVADGAGVAPAIAEAVRVSAQQGRPLLESLVDALAPQRMVIVLDNCEHLVDACATVVDTLARRSNGVQLLCTSREPLGVAGEAIYRVPPLSLPDDDDHASGSDAMALFLDRAAVQGAVVALDGDNISLLASVCRRLDGMPLAIELAAARLRTLSIADIFDRLDQRFRLLTGGSRSALPRQQTLRATVDWSYSLLNRGEQAVLRRLSVFVDGFDLQAAERVAGLADIDVLDVSELVASLVDKSLVAVEPSGTSYRYRLLETIRQFAVERMVETGDEEAVATSIAHRDYYLALAERAAPHCYRPEQGEWFDRLHADDANLLRALEHAIATPDGTERVFRFAVALRYYWFVLQSLRGARILVDHVDALTTPPENENLQELFAGALVTMSLCARSWDVGIAQSLADRSVEVARRADSPKALIDALWNAAAIKCWVGDSATGWQLGAEGVERARALGDDLHLALALLTYLIADRIRGSSGSEYDDLMEEGISRARLSGNLFLLHVYMNNSANDALQAGDVSLARTRLEEAEHLLGQIGIQGFATVDLNFATVLRLEGDLAAAASRFEMALRACHRSGDRHSEALAILGLACVKGDQGDRPAAALLHGKSAAEIDATGESLQNPEANYLRDGITEGITHLGDDEWQRLFLEGHTLSYPDVLELANKTQ